MVWELDGSTSSVQISFCGVQVVCEPRNIMM